MTQKRLDELRDMILDRVTLKQGKTQCRRVLITDPVAHVVIRMWMRICYQNEPSDAESNSLRFGYL